MCVFIFLLWFSALKSPGGPKVVVMCVGRNVGPGKPAMEGLFSEGFRVAGAIGANAAKMGTPEIKAFPSHGHVVDDKTFVLFWFSDNFRPKCAAVMMALKRRLLLLYQVVEKPGVTMFCRIRMNTIDLVYVIARSLF